MYVLAKVTQTHAGKLDLGKRSIYFAIIDDTEATKVELGRNYKQATKGLKNYRKRHPGECVNIKWTK